MEINEKKSLIDFFKRQINQELYTNSKKSFKSTFENWDKNLLEKEKEGLMRFCKKFNTDSKLSIKGYGAILLGETGTGKTYAVDCIYNELKEDNVILRTNLSKMFEVLKDNFNNEKSYSINRFYKEIKMLDLLIIDDLGSEKKTEWNTEILFNIVNICYENGISIFITTNLTEKEELKKYLDFNGSNKILDRLLDVCKIYEFKEKIRKNLSGW